MMDPELKQALAGMEARLIQHIDERLDTTDTKLESLPHNLDERLESFRHHLDERLEATETKLLTWFHKHALTNEI
jgi:exonuclease VII large subunit